MKTLHKRLSADIEISGEGKQFTAKITNDAVDRDKEVLLPDGLDASEFATSGTIFFDHGMDPNVGRVPVAKPVALKQVDNSWFAKGLFVPRPPDHPKAAVWFPDTLHHLMKFGAVRGVSVGFIPVETRNPTAKDRKRFGDHVERIYSKWKMTEFSITAQPANQEALIEAVSKGFITESLVKSMFHVELKGKRPKPKVKKIAILVYDMEPCRPPYKQYITNSIDRVIAIKRGAIELERK